MVGPHPEKNANSNSPSNSQMKPTRPTQEQQNEDDIKKDNRGGRKTTGINMGAARKTNPGQEEIESLGSTRV